MFAIEVGFVLIVIVLFLIWLLFAKTYRKLGSFVIRLFKPFREPEEKENKTNEQPNGAADAKGSGVTGGIVKQ